LCGSIRKHSGSYCAVLDHAYKSVDNKDKNCSDGVVITKQTWQKKTPLGTPAVRQIAGLSGISIL